MSAILDTAAGRRSFAARGPNLGLLALGCLRLLSGVHKAAAGAELARACRTGT